MELVRDGHPMLSRRLFYLPPLCDSEMDRVPGWVARGLDDHDVEGYFLDTRYSRRCLSQTKPIADVLRQRRRGITAGPPQLSHDAWEDVDARHRGSGDAGAAEAGVAERNVLRGGSSPVLVGRLVSVGRLTYFGRADHTHRCPYKCCVRIGALLVCSLLDTH